MESTKNVLPPDIKQFYEELSDYLDIKLLFYGSIQRYDYFHNCSDIDVDIFTDNEQSTIEKITHFLHLSKKKVKKVVWNLNNHIVTGYKVKYEDEAIHLQTEFSIYNEKFKNDVLQCHLKKTVIPYYATVLLLIIKYLYYKLNILDKSTFIYLKDKILSVGIGYVSEDFIVLPNK